ncbi:MAG: hypothetical protein BWK78_06105 [Thiotrichaceae bacterium IS1]|nr:MAG: hypothetical protein BWK78_06105 [Thiotrichaceae bacterium IS1]
MKLEIFVSPSLLIRLEMVKKEIQTAFQEVACPSEEDLLYDPNCIHSECLTIKRIFTGKHWKDLTLDHLLECRYFSFGLFCSTPAYHYYLPAFLTMALVHFDNFELPIVDVVLEMLTPPTKDRRPRKTWLEKAVDEFTDPQRQAIKSFLEVIKEYRCDESELAEIVLKNVWH